jgi:hypothetical protein
MRTTRYRKGDVIIGEGEYTSDAYLITRGFVEVYRVGPPEQRLSILGPGDLFGEMALITERPRSASVRAMERVEVRVFDRETFLSQLRTDPDAILPVVGILCERIRLLDALVVELMRQTPGDSETVSAHLGQLMQSSGTTVILEQPIVFIEGVTPEASERLPEPRVPVLRFPYRIGRASEALDPLSQNELSLSDEKPFQISRSHCAIVRVGPRYFLIDRGSRLGTDVNGSRIGGNERTGCAELKPWANDVTLGGPESPYRLRITVVPQELIG